MTLSDKIVSIECGSAQDENFHDDKALWLEDVREAVKELKDWFDYTFEDDSTRSIQNKIDEIFGSKLI